MLLVADRWTFCWSFAFVACCHCIFSDLAEASRRSPASPRRTRPSLPWCTTRRPLVGAVPRRREALPRSCLKSLHRGAWSAGAFPWEHRCHHPAAWPRRGAATTSCYRSFDVNPWECVAATLLLPKSHPRRRNRPTGRRGKEPCCPGLAAYRGEKPPRIIAVKLEEKSAAHCRCKSVGMPLTALKPC